jgi:beta-exotoxin I transport system permease protein
MSVTVRAPAPRATPPAAATTGSRRRAVVRRGLRDQRRSLLAWGASLGALGAFMASIYPSVQDSIQQVVESYPSGLKEAFGVTSMSTVEGYVHAELFSLIVPLAIGVLAVRSVSRATFLAEERGWLDTILALPLSRRALVAGSFAVAAIVTAAVLAILGLVTFVAGRIAGTGISAGLMAAGAMGLWPLAVFFAGAALVVGGLLRRPGAVTSVTTGVIVAMYALDLAGRLADGLSPLRWLSAFRYYGSPLVDGIDIASFVGLTAAGLVLAVAGALLFERRDLGR